MYTDPSGDYAFLKWIIGGITGGISNVLQHHSDIVDGNAWEVFRDWNAYYNIGNVAGSTGAAVGTLFSKVFGSKFLSQGGKGSVQGFIKNTLNSLYEGESFGDALNNGHKEGISSGISSVASTYVFEGMNNFFSNQWGGLLNDFFPSNTLSYMAASTTYQLTYNITNGNRPFKNVNYGLNLGIILPLSVDIMRFNDVFNLSLAKKNYYGDKTIGGLASVCSRTGITSNGDLALKIKVYGYSQFPDIDYVAEGSMFGELFNQIFHGQRYEWPWDIIVDPFIPYYRSLVESLFTTFK